MAYDNTVPQANQQISASQPIIQGNFNFLESAIGQEHNFDTSDPTKTYHKQASMPNEADPVALPAGTNGIYYVNGGEPKFYDGTTNWFLALSQISGGVNSGTKTINGSGLFNFFNTGSSVSAGLIFLIPTTKSPGDVYFFGTYGVNGVALRVSNIASSHMDVFANGGGNLAAQINSGSPSSYFDVYRWIVVQYLP